MNRDFHYFATYFVSIWAGFKPDEAKKIAWAAEMVDELDIERAKGHKELRDLSDKYAGDYVLTAQNSFNDLMCNLDVFDDFNDTFQNGIRGIWALFHFLPGHFDGGFEKEVLHKSRIPQDTVDVSGFDERYIDVCLKLRCGVNSETVFFLLDYIKKVYKETHGDEGLYAIGIAMHILADTWAHDDFCGLSSYFVNSVRFTALEPDHFFSNYREGTFLATGLTDFGLGSDNSAIYLGHAQISHAPDYDFYSYRYYPRYCCPNSILEHIDKEIIRINNPTRFKEAIIGMYNALLFIEGKTEHCYLYDDSSFGRIAEIVREEVFSIYPTKYGDYGTHNSIVEFKEKIWKSFLKEKKAWINCSGDYKYEEYVPEKFDERDGDIVLFARQAKKYRNAMIEYLNSRLNEIYCENTIVWFSKKKMDDFNFMKIYGIDVGI